MMTTKKFYSIIVLMFLPALFLCAQTTMDFVCRVVPSQNDEVYKMLKKTEDRFNEFNYTDEASTIKNFLNTDGCMGFVIRDDSGKKYVFTSGNSNLSNFTTFDVTFASDSFPVLHDLKLLAYDDDDKFLLIELPDSYRGKSLRVTNILPEVGQKVEIPDFSGTRLESIPSAVTELDSSKTYFYCSNMQANIGSPILIHDMNTDSEYTLLGVTTPSKSSTGPKILMRQNTTINAFMTKWRYIMIQDNDLPLNLFLKMTSSSSSNQDELGSRFVSTKLLNDIGADLYMTNKDFRYYYRSNRFSNNPYNGLSGWMACYIKELFGSGTNYIVKSSDITGNAAKVVFTDGTKTIESEWVKENDLWKISYIQGLDEKIKVKKNNLFNNSDWDTDDYYGDPYLFNVKGSLLIPTDRDNKGFDIEALCTMQFIAAGYFYQQERLEMEVVNGIEERNAYSTGLIARLQVPIDIWRIMIVPFFEGRLGFTNVHELFDDKSSRLFFGMDYGVDVCFVLSPNFAPYVSFSGNNVSYNTRENSNNFSFSAGLRFLGLCDFDSGSWF